MTLLDAEFKESDHPRGGNPENPGQFSKSGGGSGGKKSAAKKKEAAKVDQPVGGGKPRGKVRPREHQVNAAVDLVTGFLQPVSKMMEGSGQPSVQGFVMKYGTPYSADENSYQGPRAPAHECYKNAALDAMKNPNRTYVEGYVVVHGVPLPHAWTVDETGQVYDTTVNPGPGIDGYFGVPFSRGYLLKTITKNRVYGLLGSRTKNLGALVGGEERGWHAPADPDRLTPRAIADRVTYADKIVSRVEPTDKINTPERRVMRKKIADDLYGRDLEKRSRNRRATIILGLPGAGKSTVARPLLDGGALEIDPDLAKQEIPEFSGGIGATAVHEESSEITRDVLARAVQNGDDFVWPRIDSPDKVVRDLENLKKAGYSVDVKFIDVPYQVAVKRALDRFIRTGRYVSLEVIKSYGDTPRETFNRVRESGLVSSAERVEV